MPSSRNRRAPRIQATLRCLATKACEKGGLADSGLELPGVATRAEPVWHLFVIRTTQRDRLQRELKSHGIDVGVHYPLAIHQQPAYKYLDIPAGRLPQSERAAATVLSLPLYPELTDQQLTHVVEVVRAVVDAGVPR